MKAVALLIGMAMALNAQDVAQPPQDVLDFFRSVVTALANKDAEAFLDHFDPKMPDYQKLRDEIDLLLGRSDVGSTIEIVSDSGNGQKREMQLDWVLQIDQDLPRRQIVKCTLQREQKKWKITSLEPVEFFR